MVRRLLWREGENHASLAQQQLSCILWHFVWIIVLKPASALQEELLKNYLSSPRGHVSPPVICLPVWRNAISFEQHIIQIVYLKSLIIYSIFFSKRLLLLKKLLNIRLFIDTFKRLLLIVTKTFLIYWT